MPLTLKKKIDLILSEVGLEEDAYEINSNIPGDDVDIIREGYFRQEEDFVQRKLLMEHPNLFYRYMWPSYESIFPPRYDPISTVTLHKVCISYRYQFAAIMLKEEKFLKEKAGVFIAECKEKLLAMGYKEGDLIRLKTAAESNAEDLLDLQEEIDALEVCARE